MARTDTFFLRAKVEMPASTDYTSTEIDISAYTNPSVGRVLVIDRGFITIGTGGNGPVTQTDIGSGAASKNLGAQCTTETQTGLVEMTDNSLFMKVNFYASTVTGPHYSMIQEIGSLNPAEYTGGFICPTDKIHCGVDTGAAWGGSIDVGFLFEVHTEKLSLQRIQELLVSLTAN